MIKRFIVCDRCEKNKPVYIIPKDPKWVGARVFCEECAKKYYGIEKESRICGTCGKEIHEEKWASSLQYDKYCSVLCAIKAFFKNCDKCDQPRFFTEDDEESLCGEED